MLMLGPGTALAHDGDLLCAARGRPDFGAGADGGADPAAQWLALYRRHGADAAAQVRGRFSVVVTNEREGSTWAATDRFGTHPLCFRVDGTRLRCAERADELGDPGRLSTQALFDYLYFHVIPAPRTVFDGVQRLPGGHFVHWRDARLEVRPTWQPAFDEPRDADFAACKSEFLALVRAAVEDEARAPQVGAFLSGGTDSSTVCGMLGRVLGEPARCYSIGFDASGYDEMAYARIAARHFGARHHAHYVTPDDLLEGIAKVARHHDQPFGNSSAVPAWICAERARDDGVAKLLAGDGGDELFGGNTRYAKQRVFGLYDELPRWLRDGALAPVFGSALARRVPGLKKGASYVEQARVPMPERMQMYNMLVRLGLDTVFEPGFAAAVDADAPVRAQREVWHAARADALVNRMLAYDWKYTLADSDLPKVIGATRLAGVDVGFPLLADALVEFSMRLPPRWKLRRLELRWFFKEALRGFLPDAILRKKKHGFGLPFGVWACRHDALQRLVADNLRGFATRGVVRPRFVDALLREHMPAHPGYYGEMAWILLTLELWLQANAPDWRFAG